MTARLGWLMLALNVALACSTYGQAAKDVRDVVGVTHVAGLYHLTDKDFLNEGADRILALGSRVIKVWFFSGQSERIARSYPYNSQWPKVESLVEGAQTPYFRELFNKPFTTYILKVTSLGREEGYWRKGISDQQKKEVARRAGEFKSQVDGGTALTQWRFWNWLAEVSSGNNDRQTASVF